MIIMTEGILLQRVMFGLVGATRISIHPERKRLWILLRNDCVSILELGNLVGGWTHTTPPLVVLVMGSVVVMVVMEER